MEPERTYLGGKIELSPNKSIEIICIRSLFYIFFRDFDKKINLIFPPRVHTFKIYNLYGHYNRKKKRSKK